ncbi:hypothetical protein EYF80_052899 [Liparis tanakae]|uniref:Secreted protein n=1 Tax=Liparis tanakae TaxID=230148 RepID=A0A4Z2F7E9_9TELE|nr:hypothetical protein EYF80_052899 [Liparis tanakae]
MWKSSWFCVALVISVCFSRPSITFTWDSFWAAWRPWGCDEVVMNLVDGQQHEVVQQEASLRQRTGADHGGDVHRVAFLLGREERTSRHAARRTSGGADGEKRPLALVSSICMMLAWQSAMPSLM